MSNREEGLRMLQQLSNGLAETDGSTLAAIFPDFWKMHLEHLFGELWPRTQLPVRERIMVNITGLIFQKFSFGLGNSMRWAMNNGITRDEILEIILQVTHYAGWPVGIMAVEVAGKYLPELDRSKEADKQVEELSNEEWIEKGYETLQTLWNQKEFPTFEDFFPDFWKMHAGHLFGEVWSRPGLSLRERLIVNLTCLIFHKYNWGMANCMRWALNNGISKEEILEVAMHVAHYGGWPCGINAMEVAKQVFEEKE